MVVDITRVVQRVLQDYPFPCFGDHGVSHWARVLENGERLAETTGARLDVVRLFAVLHDSQRRSEGGDPQHGPRAAEFAERVRGECFDLPDADFTLLCWACAGHTLERNHPDVTVRTCFDADRLDLGRVGILPDPNRLCTESARDAEMLKWADDRASMGFVPSLVSEEWGIEM